MKTFLLHTLGCKVNAYESEAVKEILLKNGYCEAKNDDNVDLVIVNTCAVTAMAEHKSRQKISSLHNKYLAVSSISPSQANKKCRLTCARRHP